MITRDLRRAGVRDDLLGVLRVVLEAHVVSDVASDHEAPWRLCELIDDATARLVALRSSHGLPPAGLPPAESCG